MLRAIQQQKQYKILLIGELCQDVYVFGEVNRISPEAPVPILKKTSKVSKHGMSGNVYNNLISLLSKSKIVTCQNSISDIKKIRFIDRKTNYQLMRYDIENSFESLRFEDIPDNDYDVIVLSDYNKGFITDQLIINICNKFTNAKIFADTKKKNLDSFENTTIKLNESERNEALFLKQTNDIITTLGSKGCEYQGRLYPAKRVEVHDVCGAGDVFLATLVSRWLETKDMDRSIKTANACAALSVTKLGCYTVKREEYENLRI